uniref:Periviscerokinin-3 n=1 Tax=Perisphaeria ruficornis TaxID=521516 RepID=PVK3_PERRU|nr:RecName: Full=Periviscerokinin-3; Short=PerRu-PVK-3 [Perisphaeria ruficornis]
GSSGLIPFPRV